MEELIAMNLEGPIRCTVCTGEEDDDLRSSGQSSGHDGQPSAQGARL